MQQRPPSERFTLVGTHPHPIGDFQADRSHPGRVPEGRGIPGIDGPGECFHAREISVLQGLCLVLKAGRHLVEGRRQVADLVAARDECPVAQLSSGYDPHRADQVFEWPRDVGCQSATHQQGHQSGGDKDDDQQ